MNTNNQTRSLPIYNTSTMKPGTKKFLSCAAAFLVGVVLTVAYHNPSSTTTNINTGNDIEEISSEETSSHAVRFASGYIGSNHEVRRKEGVQKTHNMVGHERKLFNFSWITDAFGLGGRSGNSDSSNNRRVNGDNENPNPQDLAGGRGNASSGGGGNEDEESIAESMTRMQIKFRTPPSSSTSQRSPVSTVEVNPYPCAIPKIRYVPWNKLTADTQEIVSLLGYDPSTWDYTTHASLEDAPFSAFSESQKKAALFIGIDECVWDCFFNHYKAYSTEMLTELGLDGHVTTILEIQSKYWKDMSDVEKETATKFCYFEEVWNEEALGTWSR